MAKRRGSAAPAKAGIAGMIATDVHRGGLISQFGGIPGVSGDLDTQFRRRPTPSQQGGNGGGGWNEGIPDLGSGA